MSNSLRRMMVERSVGWQVPQLKPESLARLAALYQRLAALGSEYGAVWAPEYYRRARLIMRWEGCA